MLKEQLKMSNEQAQQISSMLQRQGLTETEINEILNGEYSSFQTDMDLTQIFSSDGNYQNVLRGLADGYSIDELQQQGVSPREIDGFMQELEKNNLSVDNAKAINQYSNGSNMILSMKRGSADKSQIQNGIKSDMMSKLQTRGLNQEQISSIEDYIGTLDFNRPVHENYEMINQYMQKMNIPHNCYPSICTAVKGMDSLEHIDSTLASLDDGLSKSRLPQSMKLYRAIKTNGEMNPENYIGKSMNNRGYTSTSPLYNSSFAKYDDYDTVMEIYAPKGTQGSYMTQLSDYDNVEQEVLLNPNDIYVVDAQKGVIDQNGRSKTVLKGLLLSKERECYKGIDKQQETEKSQYGQEQYDSTIQPTNNETNLPARQSRFSRFFNQIRSRFARQNYNTNTNSQRRNPFSRRKQEESQYDNKNTPKQQTFQPKQKSQEKKSWELEPEEKTRIQRETAEIAKRFREQEEQQKQAPTQEKQQGNIQQGDFTQMQQGQMPQQIPQQPMQDFGGMEL